MITVRARLLCALISTVLLGSAAPALADSSTSSNWAGYAVHHSSVKFRKVYASWTQPSVTCTPGASTYSAFWVGLGGYSVNSPALEQIGTEADCGPLGHSQMSAWYELVPAPSRSLSLDVKAGDKLVATVTVTGHKVVLALSDVTTNKSAVKTLHASKIDISSAEWIAEAPSECVSANSCQTLPLADFGSTTFDSAGAQATDAQKSAIANRRWTLTKITLEPGGQRFIGLHGTGTGAGSAIPSALTANGTAFTINYAAPLGGQFASADIVSGRQLFH